MRKKQRKRSAPPSRWWLRPDGEAPGRMLTPFLFGLQNRRLDFVVTMLLIALIALSRLLALPASIWDQDEAYFSTGVIEFAPLDNHPHPPWFPLWIVLGKLGYLAGAEPAASLQWSSLLFSVWLIFPLTAFWSRLLRRDLAVAAALLFSAVPGVWLLAGRAYTGTAATALLAATLACWLGPGDRRSILIGSLSAGACLLIRAHFAVVVVPVLIVMWRRLSRSNRWLLVAPMLALLAAGYSWVVVAAGGIRPLLAAVQLHSSIHFGARAGFSPSFSQSGLAQALISPIAAALWIVLAVLGTLVLLRRPRPDSLLPLLTVVLGPLTVLIYLLSNPHHVRYSVPLLAFSSGLVIVAAAQLGKRWVLPIVAGVIALSCWQVLPILPQYRSRPGPALAAVAHALSRARISGSVIVADRTLVSFLDLEQARRQFLGTIVRDDRILGGETPPPPDWATIYLFDLGHGGLMERARKQHVFSCREPILRRMAQERFVEVTVAEGTTLTTSNPR